tara:strand:+ start:1482 stop:1775 length:294 start_codon:yes stop_codon:yes gene_type:complete
MGKKVRFSTRVRKNKIKRKKYVKKLTKKYKKSLLNACKICNNEREKQAKCHRQLGRMSRKKQTKKNRIRCYKLWQESHKCLVKNGMSKASTVSCDEI